MKIDPKHLAAIDMIRRAEGLSRAAVALGTSQPALSRLVADLEIRLDGPLFDRTTRPWSLTKLGGALARQGAAIRQAQDRATNEVAQFRSGARGRLRIIGPPYFTDGVVARLLPEFHQKHRDVSFEISHGYGQALRDAVAGGAADLAIYPRAIGELEEGLVFTPLLVGRNRIVCRAGHPILRLAYPSPLALLDYGWVTPPEGSPLAADLIAILGELDMEEAEIVFSGGSLAGVLGYLENSDCLSVLPEETIRTLGPMFGVAEVPITFETTRRSIGALTRPLVELDYATRAMVDFFVSRIGQPV